MSRILVLGGGLVGRVIARDLAREKDFQVTVADAAEATRERLEAEGLQAVALDLTDDAAVRRAVAGADVVVGAAPGHMGFRLLRLVVEAGKPYADIAFMPEDFLALDGLARERGVTAVVDCGVAPGLSNLLCGRAAHEFDAAERMLILVGGLPKHRVWPFEYRVVFSAVDVIEEYTRPARWVEHGQLVTKPALTDVEPVDLPRVGTVEAFNTDGLRSLATTLHAPFMKEKTLRWPGHVEKMRMLRETGFLSLEAIDVGGAKVRPYDVTTRLLFDAWRLPDGEADLTVMRVEATGTVGGARQTWTWDLYDEADPATGFHSMARTTGFPCAIAARLLARGELKRPGIQPPERLAGDDRFFTAMMDGLRERGVTLTRTVARA
ncbi:MAG TPA: saccharopine dehydrogenase family protein [Gemmatimonadales bacterium]|nr:saccharopine dehydrogenase family protein [Gemmatimonadales bacterium]